MSTQPQGWSTRAGSRKQHFYVDGAAACGDLHPPEGSLGEAPLAYPPQADLKGPPWGVCPCCRRAAESIEELAPLGGLAWTRGGSGRINARTEDNFYLGLRPYRVKRGGPVQSWHWHVVTFPGPGTNNRVELQGRVEGPSPTDAKEAAFEALEVVRAGAAPLLAYFAKGRQ